jgi:hypothetical protein
LILEDGGRAAGPGVVVCGLNPSKSTRQAQQYYLNNRASYASVENFWREEIGYDRQYYVKLRALVRALKIKGPILWTDTVKCQKGDDTKKFAHRDFPATARRCVASYLLRELEACPGSWMAIGVGRDAFATLSWLCPKRFVLGVPHCTGQYAAKTSFDGLFVDQDRKRLRPELMERFEGARAREENGSLWLTAKG